jgi:superfamily II helicase
MRQLSPPVAVRPTEDDHIMSDEINQPSYDGEPIVDHMAAGKPLRVVIDIQPFENRYRAEATIEDVTQEGWVVAACEASDHAAAYTGAAAAAGELVARANLGAILRG